MERRNKRTFVPKGRISHSRPRQQRRETPQDGTSKPHLVSAAFDRTSSEWRDVYIPATLADLESLLQMTLTPPHPNPDPKPRPARTVVPDPAVMPERSDGAKGLLANDGRMTRVAFRVASFEEG